MGKVINVNTGDVKVGGVKSVLRVLALGSCVAVIVYDKEKKAGGLAHVMLPGGAPGFTKLEGNSYAQDAIDALLGKLERLGVSPQGLLACLVGAGNVLKREEDTICQANIDSVARILRDKGVRVMAEDLGGDQRRSACLDIAGGKVYSAQGDEAETLLWSFL
jgi:chemotaxis protein CheD